MNTNDALLFLDLDRQGDQDQGTLFDEPRRRLSRDPSLRGGWAQYQALRALAWECAPEPGERMIRHALQQTRRERVQGQLARTTGSDDLAREILLGRVKQRAGVPAWIWLLLLVASLGFGAMAWHQGLIGPDPSGGGPAAKGGDDAVSFEFPAQTEPAQAALSAPAGVSGAGAAEAAGSEDVKHEDDASRQARRLLREELHRAELRDNPPPKAAAAAQAPPVAQAQRPPAQRPPAARPAGPNYGQTTALQAALMAPPPDPAAQAQVRPQARPTAAPAQVRNAAPATAQVRPTTAAPIATPTRVAPPAPVLAPAAAPAAPAAASGPAPAAAGLDASGAAPSADQAGMVLDSNDIVVGGRLRATLTLPDAKAVDLRLFDVSGKPVRAIADGPAGPGTVIYTVDAKDDNGQPLGAGTYYLRVMTAWFSRVEPIQIH
jgi:hypothetical protein